MKIPETPDEVRDFIGSNFIALQHHNSSPEGVTTIYSQPAHVDDKYTLSIHDLLEAFAYWKLIQDEHSPIQR